MCKICGENHCPKQSCKPVPKCGTAQSHLPPTVTMQNNIIPPDGVIPFAHLDSWAAPASSFITLDNGVFQLDVGTYWVNYIVYLDPTTASDCIFPEVALYTFNPPASCNGCPEITIPTTSAGGELVPCSSSVSESNVIQYTVLVHIRRPCTQLALCNDSTSNCDETRASIPSNLILDPNQSPFNAFISIAKVASC